MVVTTECNPREVKEEPHRDRPPGGTRSGAVGAASPVGTNVQVEEKLSPSLVISGPTIPKALLRSRYSCNPQPTR